MGFFFVSHTTLYYFHAASVEPIEPAEPLSHTRQGLPLYLYLLPAFKATKKDETKPYA